jgi:hypothetical protein
VVVDTTGDVGKYCSIATDCNHNVHISYYYKQGYYDSALKYATNSSGSWIGYILDSSYMDSGKYTSIGIDSNNKVHISYYHLDPGGEYEEGVLKYTTNASGSWTFYNVHKTDDENNGKYTSIAVDSNDKIHISYYGRSTGFNPGPGIMYATNASGYWYKNKVESIYLDYDFVDEPGTSIAVDSNNKVHIAYIDIDNGDCEWQTCPELHYAGDACKVYIKYATNKNGSWTTETVYQYYGDTNYLYPPSIAIDSNNKVHIAFTFCDLCYDKLFYATNVSGSWYVSYECEDGGVPPCRDATPYAGLFPSIAIDPNNNVHISQSEWRYGRLWYTTNAGGTWTAYVGDSESGYIKDTSLYYDQKVHIAYYEKVNKDLLYTTCPNIPNLVTTYISNPPASALRGSSFSVTDTVRNSVPPCGAGTRAGSTITRYRLSSDSTITASDPLLTGSRYVPPLAGGASSTGTITVTIPMSLTPGTYYLGACADSGYNISEGWENNNCKASATTIHVY